METVQHSCFDFIPAIASSAPGGFRPDIECVRTRVRPTSFSLCCSGIAEIGPKRLVRSDFQQQPVGVAD